jgi:hypothetical protein
MGMFDEEKNIGRRPTLLALDEMLLKLKGSEIVHAAEISIEQHSEFASRLLSSIHGGFKLAPIQWRI